MQWRARTKRVWYSRLINAVFLGRSEKRDDVLGGNSILHVVDGGEHEPAPRSQVIQATPDFAPDILGSAER